jgi:hypothetical protein
MQDPPRYEGAANVEVRAEATEGVRPPPAKEEGESLGSHMVECSKLTHEWVKVNILPLSICEVDLYLQALPCNAYLFIMLL